MKNKIVWLFNHYAQEPNGSGGTRHFSLAKYLQDCGWDMTIVAASVDHFNGHQRLSGKEPFRCDIINGVPFVWLRTPEYRGNGVLRVLNMLVYTLRVYLGAWKNKMRTPDVIVGSSVHPFAAVVAALLAKKYKVPFIFEVRDLWPETLVAMGRWSKNSWKTRLFRALETWLYRRASKIITLLPFAYEYIATLGVEKEKVVWISNGVELGDAPSPPLLKKKADSFVLMYFGAHGQANGLQNVLNAMSILQRKSFEVPVLLRLIGDGPLKSELLWKAKDLGLNNVQFEEPVSKNEIPVLAAEADAFIFNLIDASVFRFGISSNKLFDYMSAARPILFCCKSTNNPVDDAEAGITVQPDNAEALADSILTLMNLTSGELSKLGSNGRHFVEAKFDYKVLALSFSQVLDDVLEGEKVC